MENLKMDLVQAYFCITQENGWLLELRKFIEKKISHSNESIPLQFIPIEHGALIRHDDNKTHSDLIRIIHEFNSSQQYFKVNIKTFDSSTDNVVD